MNLNGLRIAVALLLALASKVASAIPVPPLNVPSLAAASTLIVIGNVRLVGDAGTASVDFSGHAVSARVVAGEIEVGAVLKGAIDKPSVSFTFIVPGEAIGYARVVNGYQLLFLRNAESGYSLTSPYHASLPAVPGAPAENGDELARIATSLGAVLESPATFLSQQQIALYALSTIRNPESTLQLQRELQQTDQTLRLSAAGFLLLRDDLAGMEIAEQALTHPENLDGPTLHNLDYAISEGVRSEKAVAALTRLSNLPELETRRAVASALRHTGSKSALKALASLLGDNDIQVRHQAVVGLAEITGQLDWGPNLDLFRSDEQKYLKHWREWAAASGSF